MTQRLADKPSVTKERVETRPEGVGRLRRVLGILVILVGAIFVVVTLWQNLFTVGPAFEELTDDFRPILTDEALAQAGDDIADLAAVAEEIPTALFPALSEALGLSPEELQGFVGENFPAVATGVAALPDITTTFDGLVVLLADQQELFASADAIPTQDIPATSIPWGLTIAGILVIVAGALMLRPGKAGAITAIVVGAGLVIVPLVLSLTSKAADADQMNENLYPVYTQELVTGAYGALETVGAMGEEMQTAMLPALAEQLQMAPEDVNAFLGQFPATAAALQELPDKLVRFDGLVTTFDNNLENYDTMHPVSFAPIIWMVVIGGAVVLVLGIWLFVANRRAGVAAA